ncbi:endonuclease/exonuclease/phosphatase family protein [Microbispora bryophytorum]|uniref:Endonuclease/exonuclease/phosphatase family protein n=2 Tax=Microbispora bryophytorum TaxID=1460882 RepID=A0ABR8KZZ5_9ACTN|nr:endonuclease/exonuclease/phosphatase family protein [Microbispora camponoti]MBD3144305.1 endonuclease/exonuclease/phosphatase family protein [Microbispora camponoti]
MTETAGQPHTTPARGLPAPPWPLVMLVTGVALLFDVVRVFLPSLITLYGGAGETDPASMGLYAALWFVLPFAAVPVARLTSPRIVRTAGAVALVAARLGLQAAGGGTPQLLLASAGVTAGLVLLYGCARTVAGAWVPAGLVGGLAGASILHLALDRVDLVWRGGPLPWLAVVALCAAFLCAAFLCAAFLRPVRLSPASPVPAPAAVWFAFGPMLMLAGMYCGGAAALAQDTVQHSAPFTALAVALQVAALCAAVVCAWTASWGWITSWGWAAGLFLVAGVAAAEAGVPALVTTVALGACAGAAGRRAGASERSAGVAARSAGGRGGVAALGGMLVFLAGAFLYYAAFDADLGFPNAVVPVAVAVPVAAVAVRGARGHRAAAIDAQAVRRAPRRWGAIALSLALLTGLLTWQSPPATKTVAGNEFTLVAYNIRMGFGLGGRLDLDRIAAWAATRRPDVVLLSEVDRGWLLNGGHDDLARIARGLDMRYYFAPAADRLWGDALLTNLPVAEIGSTRLGRHGYPTGAQAQSIVLDVGGHEVGIVNTHLQEPPGQAPEVAAIARRLAANTQSSGAGGAGPRPVIVAGDLNTTPSDPQMRVLEAAGLSDPLRAFGDPPTSPADAPVRRIDHVLISAGLTAVAAVAPPVRFSDHLPLVVRLRLD